MNMTRVKVLNGYAAHARFGVELSERPSGWVVFSGEADSPYAYARVRPVFRRGEDHVLIVETRHRRYEVFRIAPQDVYRTEDAAERVAFGPKAAR